MADMEVDHNLQACFQIVAAHLDLDSLSHNAKLELECYFNGGPLLVSSTDVLFPDVEFLIDRRIQEQHEIRAALETLQDFIQEAKQIYEELRAESQHLEGSTKSRAFQEVLARICALQNRNVLPETNAASKLDLSPLESMISRLESSAHATVSSFLQHGFSISSPGYPYRTLNRTIKEIRLLVLMPSTDPFAMVKCRLIHSNSIANLLYAALSYVWGGSSALATIELEGRSFTVTTNLYSALKNLRHQSQSRYLWVDAICINQADNDERNHQVDQMCTIYERAAAVFMWLGEDGDNSHLAMELLLRLESSRDGWINIIRSVEFEPHLLACSMLMQREYWSRVWIMQEVVLSKRPLVCCGRYGVMWTTLALFLLAGVKWNPLESRSFTQYHAFRAFAADGAATLASLWFQKCIGLGIPTLAVLMHSRRRKSTDLHDYIFGIAGITKGLPITINYNVPVPMLYQQLARNTILQDQSLDILSACYTLSPDDCPRLNELKPVLSHFYKTKPPAEHKDLLFELACRTIALGYDNPLFEMGPDELPEWTQAGLECLPSWVPRWDHIPAKEWDFFHLYPKRPSCDNAAAGLPLRVKFLSNDRELVAEGISFDVVDIVADFPLEPPRIDMENIESFDSKDMPSFYLRYQEEWALWVRSTAIGEEHPYGSLCDQQKAFCDTVTLGFFRQAQELRVSRDLILNFLLGWNQESPKSMLRGTTEKVTLAFAAGLSRRFFITKSGFMGKGRHCIRHGDIVCVLYGGKVPFILRPVDSKYVFLGECYVHGIMDGEAISMRSSGDLQEQTFVLI